MKTRLPTRLPARALSVSAACVLAAALAAPAATPSAPAWDVDPYAWRVEGDAFVSAGAGYALAPVSKGRSVEIAARLTPLSSEEPEYASVGVSVFDNLDHHWRLQILKTPESKGSRHTFEMKLQNGSDWGEESAIGLRRTESKVSGAWEWGKAYDATLTVAPGQVAGVIADAETGKELYRCEFVGEASGAGRPALCLGGRMRARAEGVRFSVADEVPENHVVFPEYRPVGPETGVRGSATGFFHMETIDGIDWAVDPLGRGTILVGTDWCNPRGSFCEALGYHPYARFVKKHYPSIEDWCAETAARLGDWGFTFLPCGGDARLNYRTLAWANAADRLYMTHRLCTDDPDWLITPYKRSPCTAFPNVFHPAFEAACEWWARQRCAPYRDDPWLVGYFIDNELAWWGEVNANKATGLWDAVAKKPASHPAKKAMLEYLGGTNPKDASPEVKRGFLRLVAERYFATTTAAIRKADPNHMILGCRFAGAVTGVDPVVWEIAGKYCDVLSFNHYPWADLDRNVVLNGRHGERVVDLYRQAHEWSGRPFLVTEWSFPALDTGRPCTTGGGQRFHTQAERVQASELFARTLLSQPYIAGYSFFRWLDQPALGINKYFGEDCNYGLVSEEGVPYEGLTAMFRRIHGDALALRQAPVPAERPAPPEDTRSEARRYGDAADAAAPAAVFHRDGDAWTLSNGLVSLSGRVGGVRMADAIAFGGAAPVGSWGALLQWDHAGSPVWTEISRVTGVSAARDADTGVVSVEIRAEGGELADAGEGAALESGGAAPARFAFTHRLSLAPGASEVLAEIVSLENIGEVPFTAQCLFMRPFALEPEPAAVKSVPNLWKGAIEGYWRLSDGSRYGVASFDDTLLKAKLWRNDGSRAQHPDVRFMEGAAFELAPGAVYRPVRPMGVRIRLLAADRP